MGDRISEVAYNKLSKRQQQRFLTARAASRKVPYLREEIEFIVNSYLKNDSRISVRNEFQSAFPKSKHTGDSIMMTACLLENLDNTKDGQDGSVYHMTELVISVAQEIDPERFSDPNVETKIDRLLASLK